ncbi:hypothetical protein T265_13377, partial [Opisthorchis viverrini]
LKLEVQDGDLWLPSSSLSVSAGARVATRCSTEGQSAEPLSWNKKDPNSGSFVLLKTGSEHEVTQVVERIQLTDSGTYSCNSSAFSTVFELYVYTLTLLQNASIPTRVEYDHIGNLRVVRRNLDQKSYAASSDTWLSCTLLTGGAHLVDLVTVHWEGGLFGLITNQTELNSLYTRITTRNVSSEQITTRLRLTSPSKFWIHEPMVNIAAFLASHPQRMFSPESICMVVPPILRLVYDPPPLPPANFSNRFSCTDPPCRAFTDESNISDSAVVNWTSACEVLVAYPPVLPDGLTWTWTNAHWAAYAVQRVQSVGKSAYLSELKSMVVDKNEPVSPWQILDRRRRNAQALDLYYMNISEQPPGPVVFLCWAKNVLGESAVWWPGPIQDTGSSFPPILRLVYDPPPLPPANFSNRFSCTDPPCRAFTDESNISDSAVVNWTSACEVLVAYPPVLPDGLTWTWTNAHWAAYAVQRVQSVGKSAYLSELKSMVVDKNEPVSPWQILDRRRRNAQALDLYYMNISEQPPGPVVFLCWAKNVLGESAVWWPGPIQDTGSSFWASVWWPVVGVSLELASLLIVVGIFRCCSRAGRLRSFSASRSTEDTSFGLSRLFDAERPADLSYRQQEAVKRTTQLRSPGKVPYVRLSNITRPEADEHDSSVLDQHTGNGARMHCHVNPLLVDDQTEAKQVTDGREGDEYFWDSDTEPNAPVNRN